MMRKPYLIVALSFWVITETKPGRSFERLNSYTTRTTDILVAAPSYTFTYSLSLIFAAFLLYRYNHAEIQFIELYDDPEYCVPGQAKQWVQSFTPLELDGTHWHPPECAG